jgi:PBSX family phage terminase large subunit
MQEPFSKKQLEFMCKATKKWNIAHGSVRCGKTVGTLFRFMHAVEKCPDSKIYMVGHSSSTIYRNAVKLLFEDPVFSVFKPFCTWSDSKLKYKDKTITTLGAKDEGAIGAFYGSTWSLGYCDEITLYPNSIIDMIDTRLSSEHSIGIASCNPSHPDHKIKQWIDKAEAGDPNYYALHYTLDDNPFVPETYKQRIRDSLSGLAYKRNYLGLWVLAEGAIFDFFDQDIYVVDRAPTAAEYYIAGVDVGTKNAFACLVVGVNTGRSTQTGKKMWVEAEYYYDSVKMERQKTHSEYADDLVEFLYPYGVRQIYIDPSAAAFKVEMRRRKMPCVDAENDVLEGINYMTSEMRKGNVLIMRTCTNLIREIQGYVWDDRAAKRGEDAPMKVADHAIDSLRYLLATHKVATYQPYKDSHNPEEYQRGRFNPGPRRF